MSLWESGSLNQKPNTDGGVCCQLLLGASSKAIYSYNIRTAKRRSDDKNWATLIIMTTSTNAETWKHILACYINNWEVVFTVYVSDPDLTQEASEIWDLDQMPRCFRIRRCETPKAIPPLLDNCLTTNCDVMIYWMQISVVSSSYLYSKRSCMFDSSMK